MATYVYGYGPTPILFDLKDYGNYLFDDYLQGCLNGKMRIPKRKEIEEFIATGKTNPDIVRFVRAMRDLAYEFNQEAFLEMETEEMMPDMFEEPQ